MVNGPHATTSRAEARNEREQRRLQVAAELLAGATYRQLAAHFGVSVGTISNDVQAIREEWRRRASENFDAYLAEEVAKLDAVEAVLLPRVLADNSSERSVRTWLSLAQRRARLLGLDAPTRHELAGKDGGAVNFEERVATLCSMAEAYRRAAPHSVA